MAAAAAATTVACCRACCRPRRASARSLALLIRLLRSSSVVDGERARARGVSTRQRRRVNPAWHARRASERATRASGASGARATTSVNAPPICVCHAKMRARNEKANSDNEPPKNQRYTLPPFRCLEFETTRKRALRNTTKRNGRRSKLQTATRSHIKLLAATSLPSSACRCRRHLDDRRRRHRRRNGRRDCVTRRRRSASVLLGSSRRML